MSSQTILRAVAALTGANVLFSGALYYNTNTLLERNHEDAEARMDELEGTLRGHIGLIEESLERIEGVLGGSTKEGGWGKGLGKKGEELYGKRGKDEKENKKK